MGLMVPWVVIKPTPRLTMSPVPAIARTGAMPTSCWGPLAVSLSKAKRSFWLSASGFVTSDWLLVAPLASRATWR